MYPKSFPLLGLRQFSYAFFRKFPQYVEFDKKRPKDLTDIIKEFHSDLMNAVTENRLGANLPLRMGNLKVVSFKSTRPYPNFQFYRTGEIGGFTNNHTDGLSCKIVYSNKGRTHRLKDKIMWSFRPSGTFSGKVSTAFSENYTRYMFSPNIKLIAKTRGEFKAKNITDEEIEKFLLTYNEFEL